MIEVTNYIIHDARYQSADLNPAFSSDIWAVEEEKKTCLAKTVSL